MSDLLDLELQACFRLSPQEARFVSVLMAAHTTSSREELLEAVSAGRSDDPNIKIVDILACKVRKKFVRCLGANVPVIRTVWSRGYRIDDDVKDAIRETLAGARQERAA